MYGFGFFFIRYSFKEIDEFPAVEQKKKQKILLLTTIIRSLFVFSKHCLHKWKSSMNPLRATIISLNYEFCNVNRPIITHWRFITNAIGFFLSSMRKIVEWNANNVRKYNAKIIIKQTHHQITLVMHIWEFLVLLDEQNEMQWKTIKVVEWIMSWSIFEIIIYWSVICAFLS